MHFYRDLCILATIALSIAMCNNPAISAELESYIYFESSIKPKRIKPGGSGVATIKVTIDPEKHVHYNPDAQPMTIKLKPPKWIKFAKTELKGNKEKFTVKFSVAKKIKHELAAGRKSKKKNKVIAEVTYYVCHDNEGWCTRLQEVYEIPIRIEKESTKDEAK